ncbi:tripartite tricarboxylate transporter substrate binding protein [Bosea sp. (in: a-proteobacteria)]|uniref:Bug family tripartite tricarboxylate transporter substrate binding protein n=1 Tax=Bosea sp. (in: a-proteobacteria) TaxID=1871050 RepID=UPI0027327E49|nr:tripartite tricarboxylate transporter substrate binding protein [Bosea sp. (in: a-proteobacteria)]MDP3256368.1 tripartite tricarboxylate transporter substrate binding protein [Bosea sp. (in: a-proteobacteria)]
MPNRRECLALLASAGLTPVLGRAAWAQAWPARPIRIVVPFPAGGSADVSARLIGDALRDALGQGTVVENKLGAGGNLAATDAARSAPDGYTLFVGTNGTQTINGSLYRRSGFDPVKDFTPIGLVWESPNLVVVNKDLPVNSVAELVAYAKARPDALSFGSSGIGSPTHLAAELFKAQTGAPMTHVPYRGQAPAITDLLSGQLQVMFPLVPDILVHLQSGAVKALGIAAPARSDILPAVPTMAEAGAQGVVASAWIGLFAPAGLEASIRARLERELAQILGKPGFVQRLRELGVAVQPVFGDAFVEKMNSERAHWAKLIGDLGVKID